LKLLWGAFVALHALRVVPTALALAREGKLLPWRRAAGGRREQAERVLSPELARTQPAEGPSEAAPLVTALGEVRALVRAKGGEPAPTLLERLDQLEVAVGDLSAKEAELQGHVSDRSAEELGLLERQLGERLEQAEEGQDRDAIREELAAIVERRRALDEAGRVLERLRTRQRAAAHQIERLRVDLASADARALRVPDLSTRIDEIRLNAEALEEVEEALAARPTADR